MLLFNRVIINIPLNTNANDENVLAACRMGLCVLDDSQKQPLARQVAGSQSVQMSAGNRHNKTMVAMETRRAVKMGAIFGMMCWSSIRPVHLGAWDQ